MARADALLGQPTQSLRGVVRGVALAGNLARHRDGRVPRGPRPRRARSGDRPGAAPGGSSPGCPVLPSAALAQHAIGGWARKPPPRTCNGLLDAIAQFIERTNALLLGGARPLLQPALGWLLGLDPRLVAEQPEQDKIGIVFAVQDRLQVKLDIGLPGEADVFAQQAQPQAVGDNAPQVSPERFSNSWTRLCGLLRSPAAVQRVVIQVYIAADQMNGRVLPGMGDGVTFVLDLKGFGCEQAAIAQFREERQQPAFPGQCCARVLLGQFFSRGFEGSPRAQ